MMETRGAKLAARRPPAGYAEAGRAARYLATRWATPPRVGIILGSGLGEAISRVRDARVIPYHSIPFFPRSAASVAGHAGELHAGRWGNVPVAGLAGRIHLYEGYSPAQVVYLTRVLALAGVEMLIATCAAGGIARRAVPGSFMIFCDHLNFQGQNPLVGAHDSRWGERFVDLSQAYDPELREKAGKAAVAAGRRGDRLECFEGVYAALLGPSYETPAEIRFLQHAGADAVGMSTVPEVIAARQLGVRVLAVATITNRAAGLSRGRLSHQEVLEAGKKASGRLVRFLDELLAGI
ncbi:MAG TPA: purine-nucleoside phosphorylase [Terriglobia bacterium]|nr:purine-nucleoside phosphorylase [Terriglobia bacterium]